MPQTDTAIKNAKPAEKTKRMLDGGGSHFEITQKGDQKFHMGLRRYRMRARGV